MASTSKSWIGVNSWVSCYLVVESKPNATGNYSDVTAKLYGARNDGGNSYNYSSSNFWININGTQTSRGGACQVSGSAWQLVHSQTTRVYHNDDGSKTITVSAGGGITDTTFQMGSNSVSLTLDKIARKSTMTVSDGTLGTAQTITINRQNSNYTDTITYKCGSASGTIATKTSSGSVSWTPPLDLAQQNTTGTTVSITLTIETFNGSTSLGTNTKAITCTIPGSVVPTVSISLSDMMGYLSKYGAYVQGKSVLSGTLSASGSYGSSIVAYNTSVDGKTFTGSTFTVNPIANSGTLTVSVTVTDSRGRKGTASTTISVLAYASSKLTNVSAKRCDADGSSNSSGEYLQVSFTGTVVALNSKNSATYKVQYKKTSESSYTTVTLTDYTGKYSVNGSYIFSADKSSSYDIIVTASDDYSSITKQIVGGSVSKVFSILAKGLGFAFGKVAEIENALEVAWKVYCRKGLAVTGNIQLYKAEGDNNARIQVDDKSAFFVSGNSSMVSSIAEGANIYLRPNGSGSTDGQVVLTNTGQLRMVNGAQIWGANASGNYRNNFEACTSSNKCSIGYGSYYANEGQTDIYGKEVTFNSKNGIFMTSPSAGLSGRAYGVNKVLWSGGWYMNASQTATLSESASAQPHGIVLVWCKYEVSTGKCDENSSLSAFFIPKYLLSSAQKSFDMVMSSGKFAVPSCKSVFVYNTKVVGTAHNEASGTASGITYNNQKKVLRYVLGV